MEATRISYGSAALELLDQTFTKLLVDRDPESADLPLFVAVDIETSRDKLSEIGFSTFDPYCVLPDNDDKLNDRIQTHCYAKGGSKDRSSYKPYRLGIAKQLRDSDLPQILDAHLRPQKGGNLRKVVLVGHNLICDLRFLERHLGHSLDRIQNVEAILDTQNISRLVLGSTRRLSLKNVLEHFDLDYIGLHNAAHDSRYTLRTLLMLFIRSKQSEIEKSNQSEPILSLVMLLENIARCHEVREGRKWTEPKVKSGPILNVFDQDEDEQTGMLNLLM